MAACIDWLANKSPPWVAYRAIMAARPVALGKCPGVRPVGIGEVCLRLFGKIVLRAGGAHAKETCGSVNLCAGLKTSIEGAMHAVRKTGGARQRGDGNRTEGSPQVSRAKSPTRGNVAKNVEKTTDDNTGDYTRGDGGGRGSRGIEDGGTRGLANTDQWKGRRSNDTGDREVTRGEGGGGGRGDLGSHTH